MATPAIEMIVSHLNAPYGAVVTAGDVVEALCVGKTALAQNPAADVLGWLFAECSPALIEKACAEIKVPLQQAVHAYASFVSVGAPKVPAWEAKLAA